MINKWFDFTKAKANSDWNERRQSFDYLFNHIKDNAEIRLHGTLDISFLFPTDEHCKKLENMGFVVKRYEKHTTNSDGEPIKSLRTEISW